MDLNNKVHQLIEERWSPRSFDSKPVEAEKLYKVFEAARRAPSCANEQPWRFLVGLKDDKTWNGIYDSLDEINQLWAKNAPVLVLVAAASNFAKTGKPNKHKFYDAGQAIAYLTLQATYEGLFVHQMAGFDASKVEESFGFPDDVEAITVFTLGYKGPVEILPERMQKNEFKKVIRKEMAEIVFSEWNNPISFQD